MDTAAFLMHASHLFATFGDPAFISAGEAVKRHRRLHGRTTGSLCALLTTWWHVMHCSAGVLQMWSRCAAGVQPTSRATNHACSCA